MATTPAIITDAGFEIAPAEPDEGVDEAAAPKPVTVPAEEAGETGDVEAPAMEAD